jgi:hypothetical protein
MEKKKTFYFLMSTNGQFAIGTSSYCDFSRLISFGMIALKKTLKKHGSC